MKIKAIVTALFLSLNLSGNEILTNQEAVDRFYSYKQINEAPLAPTYDYRFENTIKPSFKCTKKFKKYSLDDFICNSNFNAFRDNYFTSFYNIIIKENPKLKDKALKIARERIKEAKKECLIYTKEQYNNSFIYDRALFISETIGCISDTYLLHTTKLALMLYDNDKKLFKKIFGNDYEKFKEALDDTLTLDKEFETNEERWKNVERFENKYKTYDFDYIYAHLYTANIIYILSIQYNLIDSTGKFK